MGAKKKKGGRRLSKSDFAAEDALILEFLTGSSRATAAAPLVPAKSSVTALPPSSLVPQLVQEAAEKKEITADKSCDQSTTGIEAATGIEATPGIEAITGIEATIEIETTPGNEIIAVAAEATVIAEATVAEGLPLLQPKPRGDVKCHHVKGSVKLPKFSYGLAHQKDWDHCQGCTNAEVKAKKNAMRLDSSIADLSLTETGSITEALSADSLWMCLSCFEINCGKTIKDHALTHHDDKKHNHPLVVNTGTLDFWCFECDSQIVPSNNKNPVIHECLAKIKNFLQIKQSKMKSSLTLAGNKTKESHATAASVTATVIATAPKVKVFTPGLQNLGNTCFFNSVVQILTETKSLKSILSEDEKERAAFPKSLASSTDVGIGPLTTNFKEFLHTTRKQKGGVVTPRELFMQIAKKWKIFRGFKQQDSHELMRYLFDGIKQEELDLIKRQLSEEAEQEKIAKGQELSADEIVDDRQGESREAVEKTSKYVPFIDSCFSGKLVSVIVCDTCKKCSYAPEEFFDLSLPVRGPSQAGVATGSSLRARLLPQSKRFSSPSESEPSPVSVPLTEENDPMPESEKPSEAHMRHIEKVFGNIGQSNSETLSITRSLIQFSSVDVLDGENKFACENCYNLVHAIKDKEGQPTEQPEKEGGSDGEGQDDVEMGEVEEEEHSENKEVAEDSSETFQMDKARKQDEKDQSSDSSTGSLSEDEDEDEELTDRFGNTVPKKGFQAESKKAAKEEEPKHIFRKAFKRYLVSQLPPTLVLHLKRFEQSGRFGQMRKIEDHVEIPTELDMGPYFVPKSEIEDEDEAPEQERQHRQDDDLSKKYKLYGAVVHMGTLSGGHYINYVLSSKVSSEIPKAVEEKEKQRGKTKTSVNREKVPDIPLEAPQAQEGEKKRSSGKKSASSAESANGVGEKGSESLMPQEQLGGEVEEVEDGESDIRQWISCSDSNVRPSSLEEVLASRAYLLFYERC